MRQILFKSFISCSKFQITKFARIKKWPIVVSQIHLHKSKQKPFVLCCTEGIVPRIGEDGSQIVVNLSACQIRGIRGEGFGKLYIKMLLTQGYPGERMRFKMLGFSINCYVLCICEPVD